MKIVPSPEHQRRIRMAGDVWSDPTATAMGLKDLLPLAVGAGVVLGGAAIGSNSMGDSHGPGARAFNTGLGAASGASALGALYGVGKRREAGY